MIDQPKHFPAAGKGRQLSRRDKEHLDDLLDEALEDTFPASDPPAMLEPAPDSMRTGNADLDDLDHPQAAKRRPGANTR